MDTSWILFLDLVDCYLALFFCCFNIRDVYLDHMLNIIMFILLLVGVASVMVSWLRADLQCPPPRIVYRYVPKHPLDVQFGNENMPTQIYEDMFTKGTPWIGGYELGSGKTYVFDDRVDKIQNMSSSAVTPIEIN
jgi:hypothetical protein